MRHRRRRGSWPAPRRILDGVHRRHRQAGAIDDATDVALEPHVAEIVLRRFGFARILLREVAHFGHVAVPEQSLSSNDILASSAITRSSGVTTVD